MRRIRSIILRAYLSRLEQFAKKCGVPVVRFPLLAGVLGQLEERRIVLRTGLTLERQLLTLVHELTHFIIHCNASPRINRTVCEYEAEAVEKWVGSVLSARPSAADGHDPSMTEDLLACSVVRVRWAAEILLQAARDGAFRLTSQCLQAQPAVELDATACEKFVLNDELHGMGDLVGLT